MKTCDSCWLKYNYSDNHCVYKKLRPVEDTCNKHSLRCNNHECDDEAIDGEELCEDCMILHLGIEKRAVKNYQYFDSYGNFLGNSDDCDVGEIIDMVKSRRER